MSIIGNAVIMNSSSGPTPPPTPVAEKVVELIDYDGTVLYEYTADEFQALSALPSNPSHTGLTAQGWNWSLADAKAQVTAMGGCTIGQSYITDDGSTRIYVHLEDRLKPYCKFGLKGTVTIDWGDGSSLDTVTGTNASTIKNTQHIYTSSGDYVIKIKFTSSGSTDELRIFGSNSVGSHILGTSTGTTTVYSSKGYLNSIKRVELGSKVGFGNYAFYNCYNLKYITIPSGTMFSTATYVLYYCQSLEAFVLPSDCSAIGNNFAGYAVNLIKASLPKGITVLSQNCFTHCYKLPSINLPSTITSFGTYVFSNCVSFKKIILPGISSIPNNVFEHCENLLSITIPNSVTTIEQQTFAYCYNLSSVVLSNKLVSTGTNAFSYCYSLSSISFPSTFTTLGASTFASCNALEHIEIPSTITSIGTSAFSTCRMLSSVTLSGQITTLPGSIFNACPVLIEVDLPNTVTSIGLSAFNGCSQLESVTLSSELDTIDTTAFQNCYVLQSITIPSKVTSIGANAFKNCYSLAYIKFESTTPPVVGDSNAWSGVPTDCIIYVPSGTLSSYTTSTNYPSSSTYTYVEY